MRRPRRGRSLFLATFGLRVPLVLGQHKPLELGLQYYHVDGMRTCDPSSLQIVNCPDVEHGLDWREFLAATCENCQEGKLCSGTHDPSNRLMRLASHVVNGDPEAAYSCIHGVLAATLVIAQVKLLNVPMEMEMWLNRSFALKPFPFHSTQYGLYTNMIQATLLLCDNSEASKMKNKFVPKAHHENSGVCGITYTDQQLARRCRSRRYDKDWSNGRRSEVFRSIRCPSNEISLDAELSRKLRKYGERAATLQCQSRQGMWRMEMNDVHKCVIITVAHLLDFRPGQLVLDWGSGCGHKLTWAKMLFDVDGFGVEITEGAVTWAQEYGIGTFCHADGRNLTWLPEKTFDHVFSYAALYHMTKEDQCTTGVQLVTKLRIGGKAFFGWNHLVNMSHWDWRTCFETATAVEVQMDAIEDGFLFPPDPSPKEGSHTHFLYQYPAYSLFITRIS